MRFLMGTDSAHHHSTSESDARNQRILRDFDRLKRSSKHLGDVAEIAAELSRLTTKVLEVFMAGQTEQDAKLAELEKAVEDDELVDDANADAMQAEIDRLTALGTPDTQPTIDTLTRIMGKLHGPKGRMTEPGSSTAAQ
ncbi:MAG TPA: hypothetical protein VK636_14930 [Gemmatimonadaceae bacterium]|nr:hypothetical protein [Gemmatimonadaceae bacterium]